MKIERCNIVQNKKKFFKKCIKDFLFGNNVLENQ